MVRSSNRRCLLFIVVVAAAIAACQTPRTGRVVSAAVLGTADAFTVLAGSTVTNTGPSTVIGHLGVSPGSAVTGFPPGVVTGGVIHAADAVALQAQADVTTAYNTLAGLACDHNITGMDLGGLTLTPGVYCSTSPVQLTGVLTLDAAGNPDSVFVFQIASTLTTASNAAVRVINGAQPCNAYWQVGSSATLGTATSFIGSILALTSISLTTGVQVLGRALARNGAVTMDTNHLEHGTCLVDGGANDSGTTDAGPSDTGAADVGATDGGAVSDAAGLDATTADSGGGTNDAATADSGGGTTDAAMADTGVIDAGGATDSAVGGDSGVVDAGRDAGSSDGGLDAGGGDSGAVDSGFDCCVGTACGLTCVDLNVDTNNCGACGRTCTPGEYCSGMSCVACASLCAGSCANLATDHDNCGTCGVACPPSQVCQGGVCGTCVGTRCGGACTNLMTDEFNCGACGQVCALGSLCMSGACVAACP